MPGIGLGIGILFNKKTSNPIFLDGTKFNNGKVVLQFDDAWESVYDNGFPLFTEKGVKATLFANGHLIENNTPYNGQYQCTWTQLIEMRNAGHDIQCHGYTGGLLDTLTDEQINDEYLDNNSSFLANGLPSPDHTAYSVGHYNENVLDIVDNYRKTGRTTNAGLTNRKSNKFELEGYGLSDSVANVKAHMDEAKESKSALILIGHMIDIADPLSVSLADLEEMIDYGLSIGVEFITTDELYNQMLYINVRLSRDCPNDQIDVVCNVVAPTGYNISIERSIDGVTFSEIHVLTTGQTDWSNTGLSANTSYYYRARGFAGSTYLPYSRIAIISTPITIMLSATGDASSVKTIRFRSWQDMELTLDGNGHFYSDEAGTLDESQILSLTRYEYTYAYIKVSSGDSNLVLPSNALNGIYIPSHLTNSPLLTFDVDILAGVENIELYGNHSLGGAISKLLNTKVIYIHGTNTIAGVVTNLINCVTFRLGWSNTISGNIGTMVSATYRFIMANNTLSYSIQTWPADTTYFRVDAVAGSGWSVADISQAVIDASDTTWVGSKIMYLTSANHSSMVDISQGGIWGDFNGENLPSELAVAYKNLMVTKTVTVSLRDVVAPGGAGDGTGFPSGFGDWYRL